MKIKGICVLSIAIATMLLSLTGCLPILLYDALTEDEEAKTTEATSYDANSYYEEKLIGRWDMVAVYDDGDVEYAANMDCSANFRANHTGTITLDGDYLSLTWEYLNANNECVAYTLENDGDTISAGIDIDPTSSVYGQLMIVLDGETCLIFEKG